jgi:hypothetical protein
MIYMIKGLEGLGFFENDSPPLEGRQAEPGGMVNHDWSGWFVYSILLS